MLNIAIVKVKTDKKAKIKELAVVATKQVSREEYELLRKFIMTVNPSYRLLHIEGQTSMEQLVEDCKAAQSNQMQHHTQARIRQYSDKDLTISRSESRQDKMNIQSLVDTFDADKIAFILAKNS